MANSGVGTKFVSVNLNKSYGQPPSHNHSSHSSTYGANRTRPSNHTGGGGMVALSRPRSSQKAGPKLSVPPPLNLPSLRKEHEKFDSLGSGAGISGVGTSGSGQRPTSAGMGWTKPSSITIQEKEGSNSLVPEGIDQVLSGVEGSSRGSSVYLPPSARPGLVRPSASSTSSQVYPMPAKVTVLRGEDFPSLQAVLPTGTAQKQKEVSNPKLKLVSEDLYTVQSVTSHLHMHTDIPQQLHLSRPNVVNESNEKNVESYALGGSLRSHQAKKQEEYFPGPLPLVFVNPRSDWADDERDTSHGLTDRCRDYEFSKKEAYWDQDFDKPRVSALPHKPFHSYSERKGLIDNETRKVPSSEVLKVDPYGRDIRSPSREGREGNFWRNSPLPKDGLKNPAFISDRNDLSSKPSGLNWEKNNENKHTLPFRENADNDFGRKVSGYGQAGRKLWNNQIDSHYNTGGERILRDRYFSEQHNGYRDAASVNTSSIKSSYAAGAKGTPANDPGLNFGRDKHTFTKSEKKYYDDPFMDGRDPFSGGLLGVVKRKKDVVKQTDFHDPVRESFEAELERVQRMQEQERQRIIEEQERALEIARREEEERVRLLREQEESQRRLEEEAREAAWRAEEERKDAVRRAEEQRAAREEEKRKILLEEERRKQAAKQKLLELEEKMARRQVEKVNLDTTLVIPEVKPAAEVTETDVSKVADVNDWEESEQKVKTVTSLDFPRTLEMGSSRSYFNRDSSSGFMDQGKPISSWRRDIYESGSSSNLFVQDHDNGHHRREGPSARTFARKEFHVGVEFPSPLMSHRGWISEPPTNDYIPIKEQRSNLNGDGEKFISNIEIDSEFHDNVDNIDDFRWGQDNTHANLSTQFHERMYSNTETDGSFPFGRSRYSVRQPRVLPPPSMASMQKSFYKGEAERPRIGGVAERQMGYSNQVRNEPVEGTAYSGVHDENSRISEIVDDQPENAESEKQRPTSNSTLRCDSQSTLSVSSPPSSPTHLSHDDLDASHSPVLSATIGGGNIPVLVQDSISVFLPAKEGKDNVISTNIESPVDEDEWAVENNELQEQEEYDEDEDGYEEEDEAHEGEDENMDFIQELEGLHLEEKESSHLMENLVLGFNEGVEVGMPNDEFEKVSRKEERILGMAQIPTHNLEEHGYFNILNGDGRRCEATVGSSQVGTDGTSRMFDKPQKETHDFFSHSIAVPEKSAASEVLVNASRTSSLPVQLPVSSSIIVESQSSGSVSNVSVFQSHGEVPMPLQFGLFSRPSMIPSQIPAIQIGSIQMPLPLHPQVSPSLTQIPQSQPLFQFGQLRYPSPTPGLRPLATHSMPFLHSSVQPGFPLTQNLEAVVSVPSTRETYAPNLSKSDTRLHSMDTQQGLVSTPLDLSQNNQPRKPNASPSRENRNHSVSNEQGMAAKSDIIVDNIGLKPAFPAQDFKDRVSDLNRHNVVSNGKESVDQIQTEAGPFESDANKNALSGPNADGQVSNGRGKRSVFAKKNSGSKPIVSASEASRLDSIGYQRRPRHQRMEFRVRETLDKRQSNASFSSNHVGQSNSSTVTALSARNGSGKFGLSNKLVKQIPEPENLNSGVVDFLELDASKKGDKGNRKETFNKSQNIPLSGEGKLKRNLYSEEVMDGSLQSGVVRVFEQPGIEVPSDEDDFIEVRSKRQMLNDRREKREKESRAKSLASKILRKPRSTTKIAIASKNFNKFSTATVGEASKQICANIATDRRVVRYSEESSSFNAAAASQPLAPIGTPVVKTDSRSLTIRSLQTRTPIGGGGKQLGPGLIFESKNSVLDNVQTPLDSWGNLTIDQQVMSLTQMQLDESMNPAQFESHTPAGIRSSVVPDSNMPASSILPKDETFHSISSLFSGEKIQFGAVTSPTSLPPTSLAISNRIGPPSQACADNQVSKELSGSENGCGLFFHKEKLPSESCTNLEDSESEAEAAASAIAVAAISTDEIVSHTKTFCATNIDGITAVSTDDQLLNSQSRADEPLTVSLPADLSIDTPSISIWPPLPSSQNSSGPLLSHFSGGSPHFPFYEMNPLLGGPVFTFGPHDEPSSTAQLQSQKGNAPASGQLGTWQQCHSSMDSFYGPPAGYAGSFITPHGGIPRVQGPPHMVVYNHFAPVNQFGQVGLSFMGAYISSGKQPDWKHDPTSSALGDVNNLNLVPGQLNPVNLPTPVQHFAPGSPLLPMASPLAIFDVSPYQSSLDMSGQAGWSHVPASSIQSLSQSMSGQQHTEGVIPTQFSRGSSVDHSSTSKRFPEPGISPVPDQSIQFSLTTDASVVHLPDELGIIDASTAANTRVSAHAGSMIDTQDVSNGKNNGQNTNSTLKAQATQHKTSSSQHYSNSSGYSYHRGGGASQKSTSINDWPHRRAGAQGRNQSSGNDRNFPSAKVKQIYVAKQTTTSAKPTVS